MRLLTSWLLPLLSCFAFFAATCSGTPAPANSGIQGVVTIGPMCPVERIDTPCPDQPYRAPLILEALDGHQVARGQSGQDGTYRIAAAPGTYRLVPQSPNPGVPPMAQPLQVEVRENAYTNANVRYDSGIR